MIATSLNQYQILSALGAGGMGEVFRAHDSRLGRDVAIKVLPAEFASDADRLRRFEQEARTLATLNHPNIMTVFDVGQHDGQRIMVARGVPALAGDGRGNAATPAWRGAVYRRDSILRPSRRPYQNCQLPVLITHKPSAPLVTAWAITGTHSLPVRT